MYTNILSRVSLKTILFFCTLLFCVIRFIDQRIINAEWKIIGSIIGLLYGPSKTYNFASKYGINEIFLTSIYLSQN